MCDVILCDVDMRCNEMLSKVISAHWMHVVLLFQCPPWALMLLDKVHLSHFSRVQPAWPGCTSSLHFFHGRSITSAYIAPASFTSAYIATRIQSIFLFNIRLHYTKSLSLRIEFCTFCAAGARLTSDIISTPPNSPTTHPPLLFGSTLGLIRLWRCQHLKIKKWSFFLRFGVTLSLLVPWWALSKALPVSTAGWLQNSKKV